MFRLENGEAWLQNVHIAAYAFGNLYNHQPKQQRRLLMHAAEIRKLAQTVKEKGGTVVPLRMYFKHGLVKVEIALVKGKKLYDKRADIAGRDAEREIERHMKAERLA